MLRIKLDGAEFWDIREYVREKEKEEGSVWHLEPGDDPLSDSQIRRYMQRVDVSIAESCRDKKKKLIGRHLAQRRNLYAKAVSAGDLRTALAVLRDEAELEALYPPKKIAPTNPSGSKEYSLQQITFVHRSRHHTKRERKRVGSGQPGRGRRRVDCCRRTGPKLFFSEAAVPPKT